MATQTSFRTPSRIFLFFDKKADTLNLLLEIDKDFEENLARFPPANHNALAPISYTGFRWASQIDPLWNAYFLGLVISISEEIERARIPKADKSVFSYRIDWEESNATLSTGTTIGAHSWSIRSISLETASLWWCATFQSSTPASIIIDLRTL